MNFIHDYLSVQFDPAHLLAELGFSVVFEAVQFAALALLWKRRTHPRFDRQHGLKHQEE